MFVWMSCPLSLCKISCPVPFVRAKYVRNYIAGSNGSIPRLHSQRDLHVGLTFRVGVVLGVLTQSFMDDEVVELDLTAAHVLADGGEIFVDALNDDLRGFARQNPIQHVLRDRLRQRTVLAAFHVEAFDLRGGSVAILELDGGVFFLLE